MVLLRRLLQIAARAIRDRVPAPEHFYASLCDCIDGAGVGD
ncbi:hypothetical protein [Robbsia sp. KACC 23696]